MAYYEVLPVLIHYMLWELLKLNFAVANWIMMAATCAEGAVWQW